MRHFQSSAVERRINISSDFTSHPMEAGWASEAIFFLIVEELSGDDTVLNAEVQLSADGINWVSEGSTFQPISKPGHYFVKVEHFGNWLRVSGQLSKANTQAKLSVHLHLKE